MPSDITIADRKKALRSLTNSYNKKFAQGKGHKVMATADEVPNPYFLRRPSGIMQLDIDTGGGLPAGGVSVISGPDQAGKTFLLNKYYAQQQRLLGNSCCLALASVESPPDFFFMRKCGVKIAIPDVMIEDREKWLKDELKEFKVQVGDFIIIREVTAELLFDAIIDSVRSQLFDIIGLDSISAIQANAEASTGTFEKSPQQAADANLITRFYKKYYPLTLGLDERQNKTTLIFTSQVRFNRKKTETMAWNPGIAAHMKDFTSGGSYAGRHGKLIELSVWGGKKEAHKEKVDGKDIRVIDGKTICWEVTKGKAGTHDGITGEVGFDYDKLTDDLRTIIVAGMRQGILVEKNGLLTLLHASTHQPTVLENIAGPDLFCEHMAEDIKLEIAVRREILAGIQCTYV
jgi:RecA/RadA recombinase